MQTWVEQQQQCTPKNNGEKKWVIAQAFIRDHCRTFALGLLTRLCRQTQKSTFEKTYKSELLTVDFQKMKKPI